MKIKLKIVVYSANVIKIKFLLNTMSTIIIAARFTAISNRIFVFDSSHFPIEFDHSNAEGDT